MKKNKHQESISTIVENYINPFVYICKCRKKQCIIHSSINVPYMIKKCINKRLIFKKRKFINSGRMIKYHDGIDFNNEEDK